MTNYKETLNLPETTFPMKANLEIREPLRLSQWQKTKLYESIREARKGKKRFILHDGPPYANGHLHLGHALNKILKDMFIKFKTLDGYDAPFVPGWDCHGLPIELHVEKKVGRAGGKLTHSAFRKACREYAGSQIEIQKREFERLGVLGDFANPYATYDYTYEADVIRALAQIYKNGHLMQGFKPVHWCIDCRSALAEAELEYEDKVSASIDCAFYATDPSILLACFDVVVPEKPVIAPIWTTTPWSLPANEAISVHPTELYALLDFETYYCIVSVALKDSVLEKWGALMEAHTPVATIEGRQLAGQTFKHPFLSRVVPIIYGDHVTMDVGTGLVHTAPAHGPEDYEIARQFNLDFINPVLPNGCYNDEVPFFAGMRVLGANEAVIQKLKETGTLLHETTLSHSYPHCWRHKTPILFLATPQWFISMDQNGLRAQLLQAISSVAWVPHWGQERMVNMIKTRPDWCISRQRAWGTPLPLFVHKMTRALHPDTLQLLEKVAALVEKEGIDAWFNVNIQTFLGEDAEQYEKVTDTLDVWFDAGVSHFAVLSRRENLGCPADIYLEGSDQYRGWFNSSLTTAVAMFQKSPYRMVISHGYTVDSEGKKLSKSKGNYVALNEVLRQYGADIVRLWVASSDYHNEVSISDEIMRRTADMYRRVRNTMRFLLANLKDFDPSTHAVLGGQLIELDAWILEEAIRLQSVMMEAAKQGNFHLVCQKIHHFCSMTLSSFYLDIIKDRQYTAPKDSLARRSCQTAMYHLLMAMTRWLMPILSFTAEEIMEAMPWAMPHSLFTLEWYDAWPSLKSIDLSFWERLQAIRDAVNQAIEVARDAGEIGSSLEAFVTLYVKPSVMSDLQRVQEELRFIFITSDIRLASLQNLPESLMIQDKLGIAVHIAKTTAKKCERCWQRVQDVGALKAHPTLCVRCGHNISGQYEVRCFA